MDIFKNETWLCSSLPWNETNPNQFKNVKVFHTYQKVKDRTQLKQHRPSDLQRVL